MEEEKLLVQLRTKNNLSGRDKIYSTIIDNPDAKIYINSLVKRNKNSNITKAIRTGFRVHELLNPESRIPMLKKLISLCVASTLSLLAISCASSKVVINQEYKHPSHNEPSLVIILKGNPLIDYDGNVGPEFGPGEPNGLITNFFKNQLINDILAQTSIKEILFDTCSSMGYYDHYEVVAGNSGTQSISVLGKGGSYTCRNINPTYVLTLSDIFIGTALETSYNPDHIGSNDMMMGGHTSISKKLTYRAQVTLFDNIAKEHVEYGYINQSAQGFFPVITIGVWKSVSSSFVSKIFSGVHF